MEKFKIELNTLKDVTAFINITTKYEDKVTVYSGRYIVDGKSIMGIFSLDLTKPIEIEFYGHIPYEVKEGMKKFIVD